MRAQLTGLWRHTDFLKLWAGQTISDFGTLVGRFAFQWTAVVILAATPFQVSLLRLAELVPGFLVGLMAGVWVDRLRRRPILIWADVGRALLLASIPAAALLHQLRLEQLYLVTLLVGGLTVCFDVAYQSYLPSLVQREELLEGNSKLQASSSVAEFGAFSLAGILVQALTAPLAVLIDAVSFLFSVLSVALIRAPEEPPVPSEERGHFWQEVGEGKRLLLEQPLLRAMAGATLARGFARGVFGTLYLLYMARQLGFAPGVLGVIFGVGGFSSLFGSLVAGRVTRRWGIGPVMVGMLVLVSVAQLFVPLAGAATLAGGALLVAQQLLGDSSETIYMIAELSLRQAIAPNRLQGRVNASMRVLLFGATLAGTLIGGLLGERIGIRAALVLGALAPALAALRLLLSPLRGLRETPSEAVGVRQ